MTIQSEALQNLLQQPYQPDTWQNILSMVFSSVNILRRPHPIPTDKPYVTSLHQIGVVRLAGGKNLALLEVVLNDTVDVFRNRVGLRNLTAQFIDEADTHGVLVIYNQGKDNYRLSFITKESGITPQGELTLFETATKRYTYVLGKNERCRTPAERLTLLANNTAATLDDVLDAFSVEKLSKEFFSTYKSHYQCFVDELAASPFKQSAFHGDDKAIRDFVKKMLGRVVFLYFLQKKGWLGASDTTYRDGDSHFMENFWRASGQDDAFYAAHLAPLFFDVLNNNRRPDDSFSMPDNRTVCMPYLNGGLFDRDHTEPHWLTFPPNLFNALFAFLGEYNFTIDENDPNEHEVGIDPEMLGHIFENLLEDNKDKGAFYTPKEIVQYMTQESLIHYLHTGLHAADSSLPSDTLEALQTFIRYKLKGDELPQTEPPHDRAAFYKKQLKFVQKYGHVLNRLLDDVKICDPAIGSGAFPMGLLNEIYQCKVLLNTTYTPAERTAVKRHIIENSIYGVDIEKGAVDIARLRFWLFLIVDAEAPTQLPNLDYKIVVGNSLVSTFEDEVVDIDWEEDIPQSTQNGLFGHTAEERKRTLLRTITAKQRTFFQAHPAEKPALNADIRTLKIDILIAQLDAMLKNKGNLNPPTGKGKAAKKEMEIYLQSVGWQQTIDKLRALKQAPARPFHHFDWKLDFPEVLNPAVAGTARGFDIVIGNPPYVRQQQITHLKPALAPRYTCYTGVADLYVYFFERAVQLLAPHGVLSYIASNTFFRSGYGKNLRGYLASNMTILQLLDFGDAPVFEASVNTCIVVAQKTPPQDHTTHCLQWDKNIPITTIATIFQKQHAVLEQRYLTDDGWRLEGDSSLRLLEKLRAAGTPLGEYVQERFYRGIITSFNEAFVVDRATRDRLIAEHPSSAELIKPMVRGRDVKRWHVHFAEQYIISIESSGNKHHAWSGKPMHDAEHIFTNTYPAIHAWFEQFRDKLIKRSDQGKYFWELRSCKYWHEFEQPKIIYPDIAQEPKFIYDIQHLYPNDTTFFIPTPEKWLLGLLNSKVMYWIYTRIAAKLGGGVRYKTQYMVQIPIPAATPAQQAAIESLVERILSIKHVNPAADVSALEAEIDAHVYGLYGLTKAEIAIVAGA